MIERASSSVHVPPNEATSSCSHAIQYGSVSTSVPSMSQRTAAGGAATGAAVGHRVIAHSWTSSISVPKLPFGWMKATVVPRLPGRGSGSIGVAPAATIAASAAAQSSTR